MGDSWIEEAGRKYNKSGMLRSCLEVVSLAGDQGPSLAVSRGASRTHTNRQSNKVLPK